MKKNKKLLIIILFIILMIILFASTIFAVLNINKEKIFKGIIINNIDVSNMTREEATAVIEENIKNKIEDKSIKLKYNDYESTLYYSVLNVEYDISSAVNKAYNFGKDGNIIQNNYTILSMLLNPKNITIEYTLDKEALDLAISDVSSNLPDSVKKTNYYIEDENLIITKGKDGNVVDEDKFKGSLNNILNDLTTFKDEINIEVKEEKAEDIDIDEIHKEIYKEAKDAYYEKEPFKVYSEVIGVDFDVDKAKDMISEKKDEKEYKIKLKYDYPKVTTENLKINIFPDLLAKFSTRYDASDKDRSTNLRLAAEKINGKIVSPEKEFSYNKIVGERTIAAGYKEGKVYSGGQIVNGIGGGVCQISSTLYNALIFANLKITERYNHQFSTSYVPMGRDATVSYGTKDLKFVNNRSYPIKIIASVDNGVAQIEIYGIKEEKEYDVSFDTQVISNLLYETKYQKDNTLPEGEEKVKQVGTDGAIVETYKVVKKYGNIISRELLSKDTYNKMDRIILQGTKEEKDIEE